MGTPRTCAQPGCGVVLSGRNRAGVCSVHVHGQHCQCGTCCLRRDALASTPAAAEPVVTDHVCPRACRALWAEVLNAAIADGAHDLAQARRKRADPAPIHRRLRAYFTSRDCAHVAVMAGLDLVGADCVDALMKACERRSHQKTSPAAHA